MKALVTGAGTGIGRAFATALAAAGYSVTAAGRREDRLKDVVRALGPGHDHLAADLATADGLRAVTDRLAEAPCSTSTAARW
ncbi:SDR family NAD(P)-dependent oxidoreductase [Amycolatopsis sp. NEAU-NG30]|uniref:SDR family NAD(P)-dependent oxidoreductase n=1 Tax=Amycolatopsis melonis TaxID=3156488 RepID=A0ABV0LR60_9PSEU